MGCGEKENPWGFDKRFITGYKKNARILDVDFDKFSDSMDDLGDLSPILISVHTHELIGGNRRDKKLSLKDCDFDWVRVYDAPLSDGTLAKGYVIDTSTGNEFNARLVNWDEKTCEIANLRANKLQGLFDFVKLEEDFSLDTLELGGFDKSDFFNNAFNVDTDEDEDFFESNEQEKEIIFEEEEEIGEDNSYGLIEITVIDLDDMKEVEKDIKQLIKDHYDKDNFSIKISFK